MFAIDSATFSTSVAQNLTHKYDLKQRKGALHCVRAWAAKGYQPIYLSGRQVRSSCSVLVQHACLGSQGLPAQLPLWQTGALPMQHACAACAPGPPRATSLPTCLADRCAAQAACLCLGSVLVQHTRLGS